MATAAGSALALLLVAAVAILGVASSPDDEAPRLSVAQGALEGAWRRSLGGRRFAAFEALPYAKPPIGARRFAEPEPAGPWVGTLKATKRPNLCLQWHDFGDDEDTIKGEEDCLYLNVYTPKLKAGANLPVIVYIHGGAFIFGTGIVYEGEYLMDRDVVYVTINYRLGALGFLSTQDEVVPGNNGLKDQSMALRWIKANIRHFGGDPNLITAMGMSAGGASVNYHLLSDLSKGILRRGIQESGSVCCPWTLQTRPRERALQIGADLGCPTDSTAKMIECLRTRTASSIVRTMPLFMPFYHTPFSPFAPVIEPKGTKGAFITENPYEMMKAGKGENIPLLISVTLDEGNYPGGVYAKKPEFMKTLNDRWAELAPFLFDYNDTLPISEHGKAARMIKDFYLKGKEIDEDTIKNLIDALGDRHFVNDIERCSLHQASLGKEIYFYQFAYVGETSLGTYISELPRHYGVSHGDDTGYIINTDYMDPTRTEQDRKMIAMMVDMATSFAKEGKPKFGSIALSPLKKKADRLSYLEIKSPSDYSVKTANIGKQSFWDSFDLQHSDIPVLRDEL